MVYSRRQERSRLKRIPSSANSIGERTSDRLQSLLMRFRRLAAIPDRLAYKGCRKCLTTCPNFLKTHVCHCELRDVKEIRQVSFQTARWKSSAVYYGKRLRDKNTCVFTSRSTLQSLEGRIYFSLSVSRCRYRHPQFRSPAPFRRLEM